MLCSFYNNLFCNKVRDTCNLVLLVFAIYQLPNLNFFQRQRSYATTWGNLSQNWSNEMLLRSGNNRLHVRFFVAFDAHGPCVHKYSLLSHCQGGTLNRDFRKARTEKRRASSMGYGGTKPLWKIDLLKTPTLYTTFHFMEAKDRNNFLDIKDWSTLIASFYNIKALEYCGRLTTWSHCIFPLALMYSILFLLLTSNSDLTINQPKLPVMFLYFRHEPINKFNVTLQSRPPLVRIKSPKKDRFSFE